MTVTFRPAVREAIPLIIGIAGASGAGKTYSAMKLAKGISGTKKFAVIDTENGRARHYADEFKFDVADLAAPFRPEAYAAAIEAADAAGYPCIIVDSMSHEWDGDGGCLDAQEVEFARLGSRNEAKMLSWQPVKKSHRKMMTNLLQRNAHLILCFRAAERIEMVKVDGKTVVRPKVSLTGMDGWQPICEPRLPYELTASFLLTGDQPGYPKPIKLQEQHKDLVRLDGPLGEGAGQRLAAWAAGKPAAKAAA